MGSPKYIFGTILLILPLWICSSCVENVELDSYEEAKIVVNCILTKSDTQTLELYYSSGTPEKEKKPIADAEVSLLFNDTVITRFQNNSGYVWSTQFKPKYGKQYRLEVAIGKDTLFAETNFPNRVDIASFQKGRYSDSSNNHYYSYDSYELRIIRGPTYHRTGYYYRDYRLMLFV